MNELLGGGTTDDWTQIFFFFFFFPLLPLSLSLSLLLPLPGNWGLGGDSFPFLFFFPPRAQGITWRLGVGADSGPVGGCEYVQGGGGGGG